MSTATASEAGGLSPSPSYRAASVGPLELKHMRHANYRAVADDSRITPTHRHIAIANGLGWGFDGMDGVIFALISPLIIREFALTVPQYRALAKSLGIVVANNAVKDVTLQALVQWTVGRRRDADAISRPSPALT